MLQEVLELVRGLAQRTRASSTVGIRPVPLSSLTSLFEKDIHGTAELRRALESAGLEKLLVGESVSAAEVKRRVREMLADSVESCGALAEFLPKNPPEGESK